MYNIATEAMLDLAVLVVALAGSSLAASSSPLYEDGRVNLFLQKKGTMANYYKMQRNRAKRERQECMKVNDKLTGSLISLGVKTEDIPQVSQVDDEGEKNDDYEINNQLKRELEQCVTKIDGIQEQLLKVQHEKSALALLNKSLLNKINSLEKYLSSYEDRASQDLLQLNSKLEIQMENNTNLVVKVEKLTSDFDKVQSKLSEKEQNLESCEKELYEHLTSLKECKVANTSTANRYNEENKRTEHLKALLDESKKLTDQMQSENEGIKNVLQIQKQNNTNLLSKIKIISEEKYDCSKAFDENKNQFSECLVSMTNCKENLFKEKKENRKIISCKEMLSTYIEKLNATEVMNNNLIVKYNEENKKTVHLEELLDESKKITDQMQAENKEMENLLQIQKQNNTNLLSKIKIISEEKYECSKAFDENKNQFSECLVSMTNCKENLFKEKKESRKIISCKEMLSTYIEKLNASEVMKNNITVKYNEENKRATYLEGLLDENRKIMDQIKSKHDKVNNYLSKCHDNVGVCEEKFGNKSASLKNCEADKNGMKVKYDQETGKNTHLEALLDENRKIVQNVQVENKEINKILQIQVQNNTNLLSKINNISEAEFNCSKTLNANKDQLSKCLGSMKNCIFQEKKRNRNLITCTDELKKYIQRLNYTDNLKNNVINEKGKLEKRLAEEMQSNKILAAEGKNCSISLTKTSNQLTQCTKSIQDSNEKLGRVTQVSKNQTKILDNCFEKLNNTEEEKSREIKSCQESKDSCQEFLLKEKTSNQQLQEKLGDFEYKLKILSQDALLDNQKIRNLTLFLKNCNDKASNSEKILTELELKFKKLESNLTECNSGIGEIGEGHTKLKTEYQFHINSLKETSDLYQQRTNDCNEQLSTLKKEEEELRLTLENFVHLKSKAEEELSSLHQSYGKARNDEIQKLKNKTLQLELDERILAGKLSICEDKIFNLNDQIENLKNEVDPCQQKYKGEQQQHQLDIHDLIRYIFDLNDKHDLKTQNMELLIERLNNSEIKYHAHINKLKSQIKAAEGEVEEKQNKLMAREEDMERLQNNFTKISNFYSQQKVQLKNLSDYFDLKLDEIIQKSNQCLAEQQAIYFECSNEKKAFVLQLEQNSERANTFAETIQNNALKYKRNQETFSTIIKHLTENLNQTKDYRKKCKQEKVKLEKQKEGFIKRINTVTNAAERYLNQLESLNNSIHNQLQVRSNNDLELRGILTNMSSELIKQTNITSDLENALDKCKENSEELATRFDDKKNSKVNFEKEISDVNNALLACNTQIQIVTSEIILRDRSLSAGEEKRRYLENLLQNCKQ